MTIPSPRSRKRARIEIIPLIDIIFFLLATFVMVSLSMIKNRGIPINLPRAETGVAQARERADVITVTDHQEVYFNKDRITLDQLRQKLDSLRKDSGDPKILIQGDDHAQFREAISILDEVRKAGINRVAIETRPKR